MLSIYFIIHLGALNSKNETFDHAEAESTDDATTDEQAEQNKNESDKTIVTESITNAVMEVYFISKGAVGADVVVFRTQTKIRSISIIWIKLFCTGISYTQMNSRLPLRSPYSRKSLVAFWT